MTNPAWPPIHKCDESCALCHSINYDGARPLARPGSWACAVCYAKPWGALKKPEPLLEFVPRTHHTDGEKCKTFDDCYELALQYLAGLRTGDGPDDIKQAIFEIIVGKLGTGVWKEVHRLVGAR